MSVSDALIRDLPESFATNIVVMESGCWEWQGSRQSLGYGYYWRGRGKSNTAYGFAYEFFKGPVPEGLEIDHICRNPPCCNPDHLEAVTHRENMRRSPIAPAGVNARKTHCPQGHPYSPENTLRHPRGKDGWIRRCKTCQYAYQKRWRQANPEKSKIYYQRQKARRASL